MEKYGECREIRKNQENVEKLWKMYMKIMENVENYENSIMVVEKLQKIENYCLGILYISMSLYLVVIMDIVQKSCILQKTSCLYGLHTFIVLFGIVKLCML